MRWFLASRRTTRRRTSAHLDDDRRLDVDVGTQRVRDVALAVSDLDEVLDAFLTYAGTDPNRWSQHDRRETGRTVILRHEPLGLIVVGHDIDAGSRCDGEEAQQLAGRRGEHHELLRVEEVWITSEGRMLAATLFAHGPA